MLEGHPLGVGADDLGGTGGEAAMAGEEPYLPRAHRAISNLKAWLHGTHRWASPEHL